MNYKLNFTYKTGKEIKTTEISNDDVSFDLRQSANGLKLTVIPKKQISDISFYLERNYDYQTDSRFFANGFQSWTDTKDYVISKVKNDFDYIVGVRRGSDMKVSSIRSAESREEIIASLSAAFSQEGN